MKVVTPLCVLEVLYPALQGAGQFERNCRAPRDLAGNGGGIGKKAYSYSHTYGIFTSMATGTVIRSVRA